MRYLVILFLSFSLISCSPTVGEPVPEFTAITLSGKPVSSASFNDKITVITIWATWCGTCLGEIDQLNALVEQYKDVANVQFIAITDEQKEKIEAFIIRRPFNFEQIVDREDIKDIFQAGLRQTIPQHLIIDANGQIVFDVSDESHNIAKRIAEKIENLIKH